MASMNTRSEVSIIGVGTSVFLLHVTMCKVDLLMLEVTGHLVNSLQLHRLLQRLHGLETLNFRARHQHT